MTEKPILFSGPMVRAILEGRKMQTRRVLKCPDWFEGHLIHGSEGRGGYDIASDHEGCEQLSCPYGIPGDRLWVRETFSLCESRRSDGNQSPLYRADSIVRDDPRVKWKPSIFMPRWASRITLEITGVRVERVQEISAEDAAREGFSRLSKDGGRTFKYGIPDRDGLPGNDNYGWPWHNWRQSPIDAFERLWDSINKARGFGWDKNPYVWVIEFKRV